MLYAGTNYCPKCAAAQRLNPSDLTQALNRQPVYGKDMNEAVHLFTLLIKKIREEDGAETKPAPGWAKKVYWIMKRFEVQFLCQTEFPALTKVVRLGIRDIGPALGYVYPCQELNRLWLRSTQVTFVPTPTSLYQDQEVSGCAGVDFQPRFTPEHCYPFQLVVHGKVIKDFLLHPELITPAVTPQVVCWWKSGPMKACRLDTLSNYRLRPDEATYFSRTTLSSS